MSQSQSLRIFVFDDDPSITRLFDLVLTARGHRVETFPDPSYCGIYQQKNNCLNENSCADVVISDIMMPKMDGIELLRLQRDLGCKMPPKNKALMSAKIDAEQQQAVEELGCHFIRKPFRLNDITTWIDECAQRIARESQ